MADDSPQLEDLVEFPTWWTFRAVGATTPALEGRCRQAVEHSVGREVLDLDTKPSSKGKWTAVRLKVVVQSADEVRAAYQALRAVDGVIKCL